MPQDVTEEHLKEGARNCIVNYSGVLPGENVLIWIDKFEPPEPGVTEAMVEAAEEIGANVTLLQDRAPEFRLGERISTTTEAVSYTHLTLPTILLV